MLDIQKLETEELRKSIYSEIHNPEKKKFILDLISEKIGGQNLAYLLMTISCIIYPIGFLYTNQNKFNMFETTMVRAISSLFLNYSIARYYKIDTLFEDKSNFKKLLKRNIIISGQCAIYALAQFYLSQPIIQTINSTGSLFVFLLDYLINGTSITRQQSIGVALGVSGVLLTVNGELIYNYFEPDHDNYSQFENYQTSSAVMKFLVCLLLLSAQFAWGYAILITKQIHNTNSIQISIHLAIVMMLSSALIYPIQIAKSVEIYKFVTGIFAAGMIQTVSQLLFIGAITMCHNTGVLSMFVFIYVVVGYLISIFRYNEQINLICTLGTILIVFGLAKIVLKNKSQQQNQVSIIQNQTSKAHISTQTKANPQVTNPQVLFESQKQYKIKSNDRKSQASEQKGEIKSANNYKSTNYRNQLVNNQDPGQQSYTIKVTMNNSDNKPGKL